jgi:replicative DNA helicase
MGKSALVANIAENVAVKKQQPVAFFSLEMSEVELAQRFIACRARISGDKLRKGQVSQKDWPKVVRACNELEEAPLWFDDSSDHGLLDLRAKARRLHAQTQDKGGLGLVIVDYLQLMRADDMRANRVEQVGQMSRGLKILARELAVPVLAISQLSRAPEQRHPPKPMLSDLRESGSIEQDADLVAFLYREDYYRDPDDEPDGLAEVIIAKHRNGPIGTPKLVFLDRFPKFADFAGQDRPIEQPPGEGPPLEDAMAEGPEF